MDITTSSGTIKTRTSFLVERRTRGGKWISKRFLKLSIEIILILSAVSTCSEAYRVVQHFTTYSKQVNKKYKDLVALGRILALIFFAFTSTLTLLAYVIYRCIKESGILCPLSLMTMIEIFILVKIYEAREYFPYRDRTINDKVKVESMLNTLKVRVWISLVSHFLLLMLTVVVILWPQHMYKVERKDGASEDFLKEFDSMTIKTERMRIIHARGGCFDLQQTLIDFQQILANP